VLVAVSVVVPAAVAVVVYPVVAILAARSVVAPVPPLAIGSVPVTAVVNETLERVLEAASIVLLVSVCESDVPTTVPEGAAKVAIVPRPKLVLDCAGVSKIHVVPLPTIKLSNVGDNAAISVNLALDVCGVYVNAPVTSPEVSVTAPVLVLNDDTAPDVLNAAAFHADPSHTYN
jgi:hypothetical protein